MIRSLKEDFYCEIERSPVDRIDDLNSLLHQWILAYNARPHSGLHGTAPLERWVRDSLQITNVDESILEGAFASRSQRTVHERTATVTIGNIVFQASPNLAGQDIEVRWNGNAHGDTVELWQNGKFVEAATKANVAAHVDFKRRESLRARSRCGIEDSSHDAGCIIDKPSQFIQQKQKNKGGGNAKSKAVH